MRAETSRPGHSDPISPTAYATGHFWYRHGLSDEAFVTPQGIRLDRYVRIVIAALKLFGGVSLDALMLARHRGIDARLALLPALRRARSSPVA